MRTAVFSDIHGNLEALGAVRQAGAERGVDCWICLGDVVGYGADPAACLGVVDELAAVNLQGNHEAAVAGVQSVEYFTPLARRATQWTQEQLSGEQQAALRDLDLTYAEPEAFFVHAEPGDPGAWHYVSDADDAAVALDTVAERLVFVGHTHVAFICAAAQDVGTNTRIVMRIEGRAVLESGTRYLVNVGSVGQPRDGDPRACFAVHDSALDSIELVRVAYDVTAARQKILAAGLPRFLADRLGQGS